MIIIDKTQSPCPFNWSDYLHVADNTDDENTEQTEQPTDQTYHFNWYMTTSRSMEWMQIQ